MSAWTDLVKKVYNENKSKPGYKLKNAMKDAAKIYKSSPAAAASAGKTKKGRKGSRKQTKKRRSRK